MLFLLSFGSKFMVILLQTKRRKKLSYVFELRGAYDKFPDFFVWAFKITVGRLKFQYVIAILRIR